jgi:DNA-binding MarR family transcriptional regulator
VRALRGILGEGQHAENTADQQRFGLARTVTDSFSPSCSVVRERCFRRADQRLRPHTPTGSGADYCGYNEGLSQTGIVARTGIDRSTLADLVRRLQRKGLLQRRRTKDDARAYAVKMGDASCALSSRSRRRLTSKSWRRSLPRIGRILSRRFNRSQRRFNRAPDLDNHRSNQPLAGRVTMR